MARLAYITDRRFIHQPPETAGSKGIHHNMLCHYHVAGCSNGVPHEPRRAKLLCHLSDDTCVTAYETVAMSGTQPTSNPSNKEGYTLLCSDASVKNACADRPWQNYLESLAWAATRTMRGGWLFQWGRLDKILCLSGVSARLLETLLPLEAACPQSISSARGNAGCKHHHAANKLLAYISAMNISVALRVVSGRSSAQA